MDILYQFAIKSPMLDMVYADEVRPNVNDLYNLSKSIQECRLCYKKEPVIILNRNTARNIWEIGSSCYCNFFDYPKDSYFYYGEHIPYCFDESMLDNCIYVGIEK